MTKIINFLDKRGKIYISDTTNYEYIDADLYLYCATYSPSVPSGALFTPELAPSFELLIQEKSWKSDNTYNENFLKFKELYLKEFESRADFKKAIAKLRDLIHEGKEIVIFDDNGLDKLSHLSVLRGKLIELGFRVHDITPKNRYNQNKNN